MSFCFLKEKSLCLGTRYKTKDVFMAELSRARSARSGAPWITKFGKPSIRRSVRPPTRTHTSCKPMSNVTINHAHLDTSLSASYVTHPYEYDYIDSCQNQTSADNYHMTISRAQMKDQSFFPLHI